MTDTRLLFKHTHTHTPHTRDRCQLIVLTSAAHTESTFALLWRPIFLPELTPAAPAPQHNRNTPSYSSFTSSSRQVSAFGKLQNVWFLQLPEFLHFCPVPHGGFQSAYLHCAKTMFLNPGVRLLIGKNIQGLGATSGSGQRGEGAWYLSRAPTGTLCQQWRKEREKNVLAGKKKIHCTSCRWGQSSKLEAPQHSGRCTFFCLAFPLGSCKEADLQPKCLPLIIFPLITLSLSQGLLWRIYRLN